MRRHTGDNRGLRYGREVWKPLEQIINRGHSTSNVFSDWLDLILAAYLSLTDNAQRHPDIVDRMKSNTLDGKYEDRYMQIVARYADTQKRGERNIDLFTQAHAALIRATDKYQADVLGELYQEKITFGERGQFFTPHHISEMMVKMIDIADGDSAADPCCGSGIMLIEVGKQNPKAKLYGKDLDSRCAKMCAINMLLFGFDATVDCGNTLSMTTDTRWIISPLGFITEIDGTQVERAPQPKPKPGQASLFDLAA